MINLTKQETFDKVAVHLIKQGKQSVSGYSGGCAYRGDNGLRCAVGALIPDDLYDDEMDNEGIGIGSLCDENTGPYGPKFPIFPRRLFNLLQALQMAHDECDIDTLDGSFDMYELIARLVEIGTRFNLKLEVLNAQAGGEQVVL